MNNQFSPFIPVALICIGLLVLLISELRLMSERANSLQEQRLAREQIVDQSIATQRKLEKLVNDLLELAADDPAAKAIVEKHGIRRIETTGEQPAPAASE